jgi:Invasion associated locus B (IalB) protein
MRLDEMSEAIRSDAAPEWWRRRQHVHRESARNTGNPRRGGDDQPEAREGPAGRPGVAERFVVPRKPGNAGMRVVVVLPNNVTFAGPVLMSIDEKDKPVELTYRLCLPAGCFADTDARGDILAKWRTQAGRGRLALKDGASRDIVLPFSFRGLAQALDALAKR